MNQYRTSLDDKKKCARCSSYVPRNLKECACGCDEFDAPVIPGLGLTWEQSLQPDNLPPGSYAHWMGKWKALANRLRGIM